MIDVEQAGVGTLEEDPASIGQAVVQQVGGVGDVGTQTLAEGGIALGEVDRIQRRGPDAEGRQLGRSDRADHVQLLAQVVGVEQVAHADRRRAVDLVGVGRTDPAPGGPDRQVAAADICLAGEDFLQCRVMLLVIGHDDMGPVGDAKVVADLDAPGWRSHTAFLGRGCRPGSGAGHNAGRPP